MGDIQTQLPVHISDSSATVAVVGTALKVDSSAVTQPVSGTVTATPSGTYTVAGTTTAVPSGTYTVAGSGTFTVADNQVVADNAGFTDGTTKVFAAGFIYDEVAGTALTENDAAAGRINVNRALVSTIEDGSTRGRYATVSAANALKVDGTALTQPVSGTVTASPTGTYTVAGTTTAVPSGTYTVAGSVTAIPSGTYTVASTQGVTSTGIVVSYGTVANVAAGSTGTIAYTVTSAKTLYLKGVHASASGAIKLTVDTGTTPTIFTTAFNSNAHPLLTVEYYQPPSMAASEIVRLKIKNLESSAMDVFGTFLGQEVP